MPEDHVLRTEELDYPLPQDRIATAPAVPRDSARLMVVWRDRREAPAEHAQVRDLPRYLRRGDLLVVNTSRVIPARVLGRRADTGGRVEGLYLGPANTGESARAEPSVADTPPAWRLLLRGRRLRPGVRVTLDSRDGQESEVVLRLVRRVEAPRDGPAEACDPADHREPPGEEGAWIAAAEDRAGRPRPEPAVTLLERCGLPPLPPYIRAARRRRHQAETVPADSGSYQTVYAAPAGVAGDERGARAPAGVPDGSVAAPTAGLHFTPELLARLAEAGVERAEVVLHVGAGTFKPVETEYVEQHPIHAEWCEVPASTARRLAAARREGRRVIAVGTTSARTLESIEPEELGDAGRSGWTRLLITPGHRWRCVDGLMTNFHLPRSSLMALVAARLERAGDGPGEGVRRLLALYAEAVRAGYRFYSYGDAMLVLPD
jgi:S-adenosylmethionine:tRNA ribosyltransferase-isomerase